MKKSVPEDLGFHVDECMNCDATWFDGGELAKVQLAFETKSQTQQVNRMRDRLNSMTPAERAAYEKRIENLVDLGSPMGQAVTEATFELTWNYYFFGRR
jgi:Zn-finger nucleic acid-binding protein